MGSISALLGLVSQAYSFARWASTGIKSVVIEFTLRTKYNELEQSVKNAKLTDKEITLIKERIKHHVEKTKKIKETEKTES